MTFFGNRAVEDVTKKDEAIAGVEWALNPIWPVSL